MCIPNTMAGKTYRVIRNATKKLELMKSEHHRNRSVKRKVKAIMPEHDGFFACIFFILFDWKAV